MIQFVGSSFMAASFLWGLGLDWRSCLAQLDSFVPGKNYAICARNNQADLCQAPLIDGSISPCTWYKRLFLYQVQSRVCVPGTPPPSLYLVQPAPNVPGIIKALCTRYTPAPASCPTPMKTLTSRLIPPNRYKFHTMFIDLTYKGLKSWKVCHN
jgi:hypothetical protein